MKTKVFAIAVAAALVVPLTAQGQNLFRTGRPDYTRAPSNAAPYSDYGRRASFADQYAESIGRTPRYGNLGQSDLDYQRLQAAWDAYRREASRYQNRYRTGYTPAGFVNQNSTGTNQSYRPPRCRCRDRSFEGSPADRPPTLNSAPLRTESINRSSAAYDYRYPDPSRTASRPVTDFFKSLLPSE